MKGKSKLHSRPAVSFTILGEPASKANSRRLVRTKTGSPRLIKSNKALNYMHAARVQAPKTLLKGELRATMTIYYATHRPDLDPSIILDALQGRVYRNDRQVRELHIYHDIDRENPRAEITIEPRDNPLFLKKGHNVPT